MDQFIKKLKTSKELQDQLQKAVADVAKKNGFDIDEKKYANANLTSMVGCVSTAWTAVCTV
ncbi:Nif11-like leader peptide family natural product precursor [Flavobacterium sp.]|jgi:hypothetical protein|uniref:Nif11-like leader peptide family natural product precursor n=1 Tax=Flavobacterium sp. TaxID=239 RepID=UPI0038FCC289